MIKSQKYVFISMARKTHMDIMNYLKETSNRVQGPDIIDCVMAVCRDIMEGRTDNIPLESLADGIRF